MILWRNTATRYGWVARTLHWTSVALVATLFIDITGLDVPPKSLNREAVVDFHVAVGLVLMAVMLARLAWRLTNPNPLDSYGLSPRHRTFAVSVHRTVYVVVLGLCGLGIAGMPIAGGTLAPPAVAGAALAVHARLADLLLVLLTVHVLGVLVDQAFRRQEDTAEAEGDA